MEKLVEKIKKLKEEKNVVILAHTYQVKEVQDIADYVGDSYGLSVKASEVTDADVILFCGVRFMAETAAILNPEKKVLLPAPDAGCPMADMITPEELAEFKRKYPDYIVMCYVNSTAEIKAMSDICCTSSNAQKIVEQIPKEQGILFVPDTHLGNYVMNQTGHKMIMWDGFCPTHHRIFPEDIEKAKAEHPSADVMIHPEAPQKSCEIADAVLSTGGMLQYVLSSSNDEFIVATELGIINTLEKKNPEKKFYPVKNSVICPNMKKITLENVYGALVGNSGESVIVEKSIAEKAINSLKKMLEMSK